MGGLVNKLLDAPSRGLTPPTQEKDFDSALMTLRACPFSRLTQKQAEAMIGQLASPEVSGSTSTLSSSFAKEMDDLTKVLPFAIGAFGAIDRDVDEIVSKEEYDAWLGAPRIEHRTEVTHWA